MKWLLLLLLLSCSKNEITRYSGSFATIPYEIQIGEKTNKDVKAIIRKTFTEIDSIYNHWNPNSELAQFNRLLPGESSSLSPKLKSLLNNAKSLTTENFDPTLGRTIASWKENMSFGKKGTSYPYGWDKIDIEKGIKTANVAIDLDGLIKGFTVDLLVERLTNAGYTNFCVCWGGEIATRGHGWKIAVGNEIISLCNMAIATSGDTMQSYQVGAKTYSHIIKKTGEPLLVGKPKEVSVIAKTCLDADAFATAIFLGDAPPTDRVIRIKHH